MDDDLTDHWWDKSPEETTLKDQMFATMAVTGIFAVSSAVLAATPHVVEAGVTKFRQWRKNRAAKKEETPEEDN